MLILSSFKDDKSEVFSSNTYILIFAQLDIILIVDAEALSQSCKQCHQHSHLDKESITYRTWWAVHSFKCNANYHGSAPGMESVGPGRLFSRSIKKKT